MIEKYILTCCCWWIVWEVFTKEEGKIFYFIWFQKYIPVGKEVLIGIGLVLINVTIEIGGVTWVFVHIDDIGIILTKHFQSPVSISKMFICIISQFYFEQDANLCMKHHYCIDRFIGP